MTSTIALPAVIPSRTNEASVTGPLLRLIQIVRRPRKNGGEERRKRVRKPRSRIERKEVVTKESDPQGIDLVKRKTNLEKVEVEMRVRDVRRALLTALTHPTRMKKMNG
jgi:hypothetical protein